MTHDVGTRHPTPPPAAAAERGIRWYLREATAPRHAAVDALGGSHSLDTPEGYRRFLRAHARALAPVEQALEAGGIAALLPDWPGRSRRAALAADLDGLDAPPPPPGPVSLPDGDAALLGAAYVLEGSRFGNGMLARQVGGALPRAYLAHRASWPDFLAVLEGRLADRALWPDAAAGALAAFDAFQAALSAEPCPPREPGIDAAHV
ncbi:biliverdin-producing heme oxygenase [Roseomonas haemaphysalidis]|uniref:Biliverdin-producing heme oxygenase n=1 Tax=Roseomonas haemaphysalidis TaxID=2768162 RepID=A0ABS3KP05_9PROT|nr:biliverdin-producing heme oxygenase [Roseomonas haemaphysalidis]MBO1079170.1 biliverdin-producing heme oxygenase [Roseomonas haemaphysalidis]